MLAAIFISIEPMAGWSAGTSGKSQTTSGRKARASKATSAGAFGQPHDAEPQGHDPDQRQRGLHHRELSHLEALVGHRLEVIGAAPDNDRQHHQPEPDVIQHRAEAILAAQVFARRIRA